MAHYTVEDVYTIQSDPKRRALLIQVAFEAFDTLQDILTELREIKKELRDVQLHQSGLAQPGRTLVAVGSAVSDTPNDYQHFNGKPYAQEKRGPGRPRKS
jgi:hypothetical protein